MFNIRIEKHISNWEAIFDLYIVLLTIAGIFGVLKHFFGDSINFTLYMIGFLICITTIGMELVKLLSSVYYMYIQKDKGSYPGIFIISLKIIVFSLAILIFFVRIDKIVDSKPW